MTVSKRTFLIFWIGGLVIFAGSLVLHAPLAIEAVPGGILDHQGAPHAVAVDAIQRAWRDAGLLETAKTAMISDLVFIGIYGLGAALGGLYFRASGRALGKDGLTGLGVAILAAGVVFLVTDYAETITQLIQLTRFAGNDAMAGFASSMGVPKALSFLFSFFAVPVALVWEWRAGKAA